MSAGASTARTAKPSDRAIEFELETLGLVSDIRELLLAYVASKRAKGAQHLTDKDAIALGRLLKLLQEVNP